MKFVEILAEMASTGDLIVWACNCLAFIRYYHWSVSPLLNTIRAEGPNHTN